MNDFTKNELIAIHGCIEIHGDSYSCGLTAHETLVDKLQFMIDSYEEIKIPTVLNYCCSKCFEQWHNCECKDE